MSLKALLAVSLAAHAATGLPQQPGGGCKPPTNTDPSTAGTGPYPAVYTVDPTLPNHTVYLPKPVPAGLKLPVVVWGEGGCSGNGTDVVEFLSEISSHGFMVLALGKPNGTGTTTAQMMTDAVDWVTSAKALARYGYVDASRIAAAGFSCGGVQAYNVSGDARVKALGIFNSGLMGEAESKRVATTITKPIFYFLGGPSDIAYANGERDYKLLPAGTPSWKGNIDVGHGGTYKEPNGGRWGVAAVRFFQWTLRGNTTASEYFTGDGAKNDGFAVESKSLDKIQVTPI